MASAASIWRSSARPNAGKSTLVNALLGESRVLTSDMPGTTRDAIAVDWVYEGQAYRLIDTAGLRRQARINEPIERMATTDTLRQIRLAQIVVLLMEADGVLDKQDLTIAKLVLEEGRALVIAVNKWDIVTDRKESFAAPERPAGSIPGAGQGHRDGHRCRR